MRTIIMLAVAGFALGGCVSSEVAEARNDELCRSYGLKPGTNAYGACRLRLTEGGRADQARRRANAGASFQRAADSFSGAGSTYRPPVTCTTTGSALNPRNIYANPSLRTRCR